MIDVMLEFSEYSEFLFDFWSDVTGLAFTKLSQLQNGTGR
jgi:hypothetical protein